MKIEKWLKESLINIIEVDVRGFFLNFYLKLLKEKRKGNRIENYHFFFINYLLYFIILSMQTSTLSNSL